jgi:hypothetical protein
LQRIQKKGSQGFWSTVSFFAGAQNEPSFIAKKGVTDKQGAKAHTQPVNLADEAPMRPMEASSNEISRPNANYLMFYAALHQNEQSALADQQEIQQQPFYNRLMPEMISCNKASHMTF